MRTVIAATVAAWALAGCSGADTIPEPDGRVVRVEFELRGGCARPPEGCPDPVVVDDVAAVSEEVAAGLLSADFDALGRIDPGELGCGDAFVDGVGLHATVRRTDGPNQPAFEQTTFCLTAADESLAGVPELQGLYEQVR